MVFHSLTYYTYPLLLILLNHLLSLIHSFIYQLTNQVLLTHFAHSLTGTSLSCIIFITRSLFSLTLPTHSLIVCFHSIIRTWTLLTYLLYSALILLTYRSGVMVKTYPCQNVPNQNVPSFGQNVPTFLVKTYPPHQNVPNFLVKTYPFFFLYFQHIFWTFLV